MSEQSLSANIPRGFRNIEPTIFGGLTKRQLITFLIAGIVGFSVYMLAFRAFHAGVGISISVVIIFTVPIFFAGFYKHNGLNAEKLLYYIYLSEIKYPKFRPYDHRPLDRRNEPLELNQKNAKPKTKRR